MGEGSNRGGGAADIAVAEEEQSAAARDRYQSTAGAGTAAIN